MAGVMVILEPDHPKLPRSFPKAYQCTVVLGGTLVTVKVCDPLFTTCADAGERCG